MTHACPAVNENVFSDDCYEILGLQHLRMRATANDIKKVVIIIIIITTTAAAATTTITTFTPSPRPTASSSLSTTPTR